MDERLPDWSASAFAWPHGTYLTRIPTIEVARRVLGPPSAAMRTARSHVYWQQAQLRSRGRLRLGMHDRGEEYIFANGTIHDRDIAGHRVHLPLHVKVIRQEHLHIRGDQVMDITSSYRLWPGLHFREELYVYMHVGQLTVEPGAALAVRGNVLVLCCDEIALTGNTLPRSRTTRDCAFEIRILGTDHPAFSGSRHVPAENGRLGLDGEDGESHVLRPTPSMFGPIRDGAPALRGGDGTAGHDGSSGTHGQNGGLAMLADIRIGALTGFSPGSLRLFAQAGQGRAGGNGGDGGRGGNGGDAPLHPGIAGNGGNGGDGGHGGNGGLSSNIFVTAPASALHCLDPCAFDSLGGAGGTGGRGGAGGRGGCQNDPTIHSPQCARDGRVGVDGRDGRSGRGRPGARIHILPGDIPDNAECVEMAGQQYSDIGKGNSHG